MTFFCLFLGLLSASHVIALNFPLRSSSIVTDDSWSTYFLDVEELSVGVISKARLLSLLLSESSIDFLLGGGIGAGSSQLERFLVVELRG